MAFDRERPDNVPVGSWGVGYIRRTACFWGKIERIEKGKLYFEGSTLAWSLDNVDGGMTEEEAKTRHALKKRQLN